MTQASAATFQPGEVRQPERVPAPEVPLLNLDGDVRWLCLFSATPPADSCRVIVSAPGLLTFFTCGSNNPNPPGARCFNVDADFAVTCLFGAQPSPGNGTCKPQAGVPGVIVYYRCSGGDGPARRILRKLPH